MDTATIALIVKRIARAFGEQLKKKGPRRLCVGDTMSLVSAVGVEAQLESMTFKYNAAPNGPVARVCRLLKGEMTNKIIGRMARKTTSLLKRSGPHHTMDENDQLILTYTVKVTEHDE